MGRGQPPFDDQYVTSDPTKATLFPQIWSGFQKCRSCGDGTVPVPSISAGLPYFLYVILKVLPAIVTVRYLSSYFVFFTNTWKNPVSGLTAPIWSLPSAYVLVIMILR